MLNIWQECKGDQYILPIECSAWRIVENQNQTATRKLVDSLHEQQVLEELIENHKPKLPEICKDYHYLLATPFRYPPLQQGSRFGTRYEPSIWYGSLAIETALAEKAYYRFLLLQDSEAEYRAAPIKYSAFQIDIMTQRGTNLTYPPFSHYTATISSHHCYIDSRKLGKDMREANVNVFLFESARCPDKGINVGLFSPCGFKTKTPKEPFQTWLGTVTHSYTQIEFVRTNGLFSESKQFAYELFFDNHLLPA